MLSQNIYLRTKHTERISDVISWSALVMLFPGRILTCLIIPLSFCSFLVTNQAFTSTSLALC